VLALQLTEHRILFATGGPALRLTGDLDEYAEPMTARLEMQDWGAPWKEWVGTMSGDECERTLLTFARQFYFRG
jgi:hypothetical protein